MAFIFRRRFDKCFLLYSKTIEVKKSLYNKKTVKYSQVLYVPE